MSYVHVESEIGSIDLSNLMKNADKIKQSVQHFMIVSVMPVSYNRSKLLKKKWINYCHYEWMT
jgi:hypothetical protein